MSKLIVIACILIMAGCYTQMPRPESGNRNSRNRVDNDQPIIEKLKTRVRVFHYNADSSRIYFVIDTRPQDYFLLHDRSKYKAEYTLTYQVYKTEGGKKQISDSASLKLVDLQVKPDSRSIVAYVETKLETAVQYSLKLNITNMNRSAKADHFIRFSNLTCSDPENYMIFSNDGLPLLEKNFLYSEGKIVVAKKCTDPIELYLISGGMDYPTPPFTTNDNFGDKNNYTKKPVALVPGENNSYSFSGLQKGIYSVQTQSNSGIIFYHFNKWYPNAPDTSAFYEPLVYISSREEYNAFNGNDSPKSAFEKFWLMRAGDKQQARKAINEYYKRVFEANTEYTSTCEGWKTDRGMMYIIFGKPSHVEKRNNYEIWHYKSGYNSIISFSFNKIDNVYSDNDYRLERDLRYKPQWYNAVENWRRGRPFTLANAN